MRVSNTEASGLVLTANRAELNMISQWMVGTLGFVIRYIANDGNKVVMRVTEDGPLVGRRWAKQRGDRFTLAFRPGCPGMSTKELPHFSMLNAEFSRSKDWFFGTVDTEGQSHFVVRFNLPAQPASAERLSELETLRQRVAALEAAQFQKEFE